MFTRGQTVVLPGCGIGVVERVLPSGAAVVVDCLGYSWLFGVEVPNGSRIPETLQPRQEHSRLATQASDATVEYVRGLRGEKEASEKRDSKRGK